MLNSISEKKYRAFTVVLWIPLLCISFVPLRAGAEVFREDWLERLLSWGYPALLSALTSFILAALCLLRAPKRLESLLFGMICILWGGLYLDLVFSTILNDAEVVLATSRVDHFFLVFLMGLNAHLIFTFLGYHRHPIIYIYYGLAFIFAPLTSTSSYFSTNIELKYGFLCLTGPVFEVFSLFVLIGLIIVCFHLFKALKKQENPAFRRQCLILIGSLILIGLSAFLNLAVVVQFTQFPLGTFGFVPELLMAFGVFRQELLKISHSSRLRFINEIARLSLKTSAIVLLALMFWGIYELTPTQIINRFKLSALPPLISILVGLYLSYLSYCLGVRQKAALLMSGMCLIYTLLNIDILINMLNYDSIYGLRISRFDHFFLSFALAFTLHFTFLLTQLKKFNWIIIANYLIAFCLAPWTQTIYYIPSMINNSWGQIAKQGPLLQGVSLIWVAGITFGLVVIGQTILLQKNPLYKKRLIFYFIGFLGVGGLNILTIPTTFGVDIYPINTFIFLPFLMFIYALHQQNRPQISHVNRHLLLGLGLLLWFVVLVENFDSFQFDIPSYWIKGLQLLIFMGLFGLGGQLWLKVLNSIIRNPQDRFKESLENISNYLSRPQNVQKMFENLQEKIFEVLFSQHITLLFVKSANFPWPGWHVLHQRQNWIASKNEHGPVEVNPIILEETHPFYIYLRKHIDTNIVVELDEFNLENSLNLEIDDVFSQMAIIQPVIFEQKINCFLCLGNKLDDSYFSEEERLFVRQISYILGPFLENAYLLENLEEKVRVRTQELDSSRKALELIHFQIMDDLYLAAEFQQAVLPKIRQTSHLDIAVRFLPMSGGVSGDIYEFSTNRDGALNVFIGDATGHGVAAAFITMMMQIGLDSIRGDLPPGNVMSHLNHLLSIRETGRYISGIYLRIGIQGQLEVSQAGHPPLIIIRKDGSDLISNFEGGLALGIMPEEEALPYTQISHQLQDGDRIFIYTDGLTEWLNPKRKPFGEERLYHAILQFRHLANEAILDQLLAEVNKFSEGQACEDDCTMIMMEFHAHP